jgi:catechol 2,3-dioxygenase-like lactoylglutathione lyase family enzyme
LRHDPRLEGTGMARGLDHIVHAVRDLDAAAALYRGLGFTVGARNRHPWDTHNHIVQFPGAFIELLTLAEPDKLGSDGFSRRFGAYNRDFLAGSEVMRFEREGKRPDGSLVKLGFSLAFAADKGVPDIHFATCQQHYAENFWNPAFQKHANSVTGIAGVVVVAAEPERQRDFFAGFVGAPAASVDGGFAIATPRGSIEVLTPAAYTARFGVARPDLARGPRLAALRFAVADASLLQGAPELAGLAGLYAGNAAVIGPPDAMGATLIFESAR